MKSNRKLKKFVVPSVIGLFGVSLLTTIFVVKQNLEEPVFSDDIEFNYTTENIFANPSDETVNNQDIVILKPFQNENVKITKQFYDYEAEKEQQQNSIIVYENTYMQNSGIDYSSSETFEVAAILDGVVTEVGEDTMLGKYVTIRHSNDMISMYQSLSDITVKKDDEVKQGFVIGKSGKNNLNPKEENQLHFELSYKGQYVNPEDYFDKKVQDL